MCACAAWAQCVDFACQLVAQSTRLVLWRVPGGVFRALARSRQQEYVLAVARSTYLQLESARLEVQVSEWPLPPSRPPVCVELYIWWSHLWQADDRITNRISAHAARVRCLTRLDRTLATPSHPNAHTEIHSVTVAGRLQPAGQRITPCTSWTCLARAGEGLGGATKLLLPLAWGAQERDARLRALQPYLLAAPKHGIIGVSPYADRLRKAVVQASRDQKL